MIHLEVPWTDPVAVFRGRASQPWAMLLDSAAPAGGRGRFSYLALDPFRTVEADARGVRIDGQPTEGDPFTVLETELARYRNRTPTGPAPFGGGAIGLFGYELGGHLETLPQRHADTLGIPEMAVGFYDAVIVFDMLEQRAWIVSTGLPEPEGHRRSLRAARRADSLKALLAADPAPRHMAEVPMPDWRPDLDRERYCERVDRILAYIRAGDIFQANFTQRFTAPRPAAVSAFEIYERLRALSPAPFAAFINTGGAIQLASASPERFLRLEAGGRIETRPIKGTRPRFPEDPDRDRAAAEDLVTSAKDRAENLMIVDLLRNDLSRVAEVGSVRVPELCALESFASVHHLVSAVEARLRPGLGPVDLLRATFPGGSITGAPKIRAMEIIDELEASRRGAYCGSIAWIGFDGAMDSNILIRTLTLTPDTLVAQAGGGIVADSDPMAEWAEMLVKLHPLLAAPAADPVA